MRQSTGSFGSSSNLGSKPFTSSSSALVSPSSSHIRSKSQSGPAGTANILLQHILVGSPPPPKFPYQKQPPYSSYGSSSGSGEKRVIALLAFVALLVLGFFHLGFRSHVNSGHHAAYHATGWAFIHPPARKSKGQPEIRYNTAMVGGRDHIIMTHGYFYDKDAGQASWLSDTWFMEYNSPFKWTRAVTEDGVVPPARYGHSAALHPNGRELYIYGGTDGGARHNGGRTFEFGYEFGDVWRFELARQRWFPVKDTKTRQSQPGGEEPNQRYLHGSAIVKDGLYVFGGLTHVPSNGDFWRLDLIDKTWSRVFPKTEDFPDNRMGHVMTPYLDNYVIVTMGKDLKSSISQPIGDTWLFDVDQGTWKKLLWKGDEKPSPKVYTGGAIATYDGLGYLVIAGGSSTSGVMTCTTDAWAGRIDEIEGSITWFRLPDLPFGIFQHVVAAHDSAAFLFGGHLCAEKTADGKLDFKDYYSNAVLRIDLEKALKQAAKGAPRKRHR